MPAHLWELARLFLRLGTTAFGGPAAHISVMEDEVVTRRQWMTRDEFVDLLGAANLIPGPNSTELAIHIGHRRAGWPGLIVAGCCFIVPAVVIVWVLAMCYVRFGTRVEVGAMLAGMQPAVLAVVVQAIWRLRRSMIRTRFTAVLAAVSLAAVLAGISEIAVLFGALLVALLRSGARPGGPPSAAGNARPGAPMIVTGAAAGAGSAAGALAVGAMAPTGVFLSFFKIGSMLFGSGYVLLSFLRGEFLVRQSLLTNAQLLDAMAIGQVTPGPVFSAATFVGFLLAGHAGAAAATVGIFLPAFLAVALTAPFVVRLRRSAPLAIALDGVNAASVAMMASVVVLMVRGLAVDATTLVILPVASLLLMFTRIGSGWVLLGGACAGLLRLL